MSATNSKQQDESSLDDLFGAARESATHLESENARHAILNDVMDRAIQTQPVRRFTPLKIGITIMTSLTVGVIGLIALGVFAPATKTELARKPTPAIMQSSVIQQAPVQMQAQPTFASSKPRSHTSRVVVTQERKADSTGLSPLRLSPLRMDAIKPIRITPEQAARLGIICESDGSIVYHVSMSNVGDIFVVRTHPDGSVDMPVACGDSTGRGRKVSFSMITTTKGEKRYFQFQANPGNRFPMSNTLHSMGISDSGLVGTYHGDVVIQHSNEAVDTDNLFGRNVKLSQDDSTFAKQFVNGMGLDPDKTKNLNITINLQADTSSLDSAAQQKILAAMGISEEDLSQMKAGTLDSSVIAQRIGLKMRQMIAMRSPEELLQIAKAAMTDIQQNQPDVNKLVPVEVRNRDSMGTLNALVFWFEPSASLETVLGNQYPPPVPSAAAVQTSSRGALQSVAIAPNPATGSTTLHYTLSDARTISVAVYDITGQKILNAGQAPSQPVGSGELKLDLSKLHAGVYVVAVTTDRGEELTQRVVVEN